MKALRAYWLGPAVLLVGFALVSFDQVSGLPAWARLSAELAGSQGRVEVLRERVVGLRSEIASLEGDPSSLERAIREELELARPGEVVVRFAPRLQPH